MNECKGTLNKKTKMKMKTKTKTKTKNENELRDDLPRQVEEDIQLHKDKLYAALKESIKINKWFYLSLIFCFYMFKQSSPENTSYLTLVFSYIFIMIAGHVSHRISHHINFTDIYNKFKKSNIVL